jgi:hypothetical protein
MKPLHSLKAFFLPLAIFLGACSQGNYTQSSGEYDDMYFTSRDRTRNLPVNTFNQTSQTTPNNTTTWNWDTEEQESFSSKNVNPDYISRYSNSSDQVDQNSNQDEYFVENPTRNNLSTARNQNSPTIVNNYYGNAGFGGFGGFGAPGMFYDPWMWGGGSMFMHDPWMWGHAGFYDPWMMRRSRWMRPGWNVGFGWNSWGGSFINMGYGAGWGHDPFWGWNRPMGIGFYDPWMVNRSFHHGYNAGFNDGFWTGRNTGSVTPITRGRRYSSNSIVGVNNRAEIYNANNTTTSRRSGSVTTNSVNSDGRQYDTGSRRDYSATQNEYHDRSRSNVTRSTATTNGRSDYSRTNNEFSRAREYNRDNSSVNTRSSYGRSNVDNARNSNSYNASPRSEENRFNSRPSRGGSSEYYRSNTERGSSPSYSSPNRSSSPSYSSPSRGSSSPSYSNPGRSSSPSYSAPGRSSSPSFSSPSSGSSGGSFSSPSRSSGGSTGGGGRRGGN